MRLLHIKGALRDSILICLLKIAVCEKLRTAYFLPKNASDDTSDDTCTFFDDTDDNKEIPLTVVRGILLTHAYARFNARER